MDYAQLRDAYTAVKKTCKDDWRSEAVSQAIIDLAVTALKFLTAECEQIALNSLVSGKRYFSFLRNNTVARPANSAFRVILRSTNLRGLWR